VLSFIPYVIHELSHYVVAFVFYLFNRSNGIPVWVISRKASVEVNSDKNGYTYKLWYMYINCGNAKDWQLNVIRVSPLFTTIALGYLAINNGLLTTLIYLYNVHSLFMSRSDINGLITK
jgi:hypothetical protein